jgi:hypothetical protein
MKPRDFIKVIGIGVAGAATIAAPRDCAIDAGDQMAHDDELAEVARSEKQKPRSASFGDFCLVMSKERNCVIRHREERKRRPAAARFTRAMARLD